jgi:hypothetical protein
MKNRGSAIAASRLVATAAALLQHRITSATSPRQTSDNADTEHLESDMTRQMILAGAMFAVVMAWSPLAAQREPQGPITRNDYMARQKERFDAMDANHDGVVTKDELAAQIEARMGDAPPPQMVDRIFARLDTDGDGKATAAEAEAEAAARFDKLDTNHDGTLSPEERRAGMEHMRRPSGD